MRVISSTVIRLVLTTGAGAGLLLGCASAPKEPAPDDYVFLSAYPNLKRVSAKRGVFLYTNPDKPLRNYQKLIIDPSGIYFQPGSAYWINRDKANELAAFFRQEIIDSLSGSYEIVENPGPGVLRMSLMLADVGLRRAPERQHQPMLRIILRDSATDEEVLLLRDITRGSEFAEAVEKRGDAGAKELLSDWARLLREKMDEARRTNAGTQPADGRAS